MNFFKNGPPQSGAQKLVTLPPSKIIMTCPLPQILGQRWLSLLTVNERITALSLFIHSLVGLPISDDQVKEQTNPKKPKL